MKKLTLLFLAIAPFLVKAGNYTTIANGKWSNSAIWSGGVVPGASDTVTIAYTDTLDASESVKNITINSSKILRVSGSNTLTVYGNFTNNGTFTYSTGTVTFAGSVNQSIGGSSTTTFYNLTTNPSASTDTVSLSKAITVNNNFTISNGVFACATFSVTGNTTGTMSMASGTTLVLGLTSSSTLPGFPNTFTTAHISLDAASTVVYQANNTSTGQTVSGTPYYGNLLVTTSSAGTSAVSKSWIKGNLTIGSGVTFKNNTINSDTIKGNLIINSGAIYDAYAAYEYLQGNVTNNGTYIGFYTTYFEGSSNQVLSGVNGPINTIFNALYLTPKVSTDTTFIEANVKISGTFANVGTFFVPAAYNDTICMENVNNNGTITALNGVAYILSGQLKDNLYSFYKMTVGSNFEQYANVTVASDLTILAGTYYITSGTLNVGGNYVSNGGAVTGTVVMNGSHNQTISGTSSTIGSIQINQSAATDTVKLASSITCWAITLTQGVFDVSSSNYGITLGQNWTNNNTSNSFVGRNGTVTFLFTASRTLGGTSVTTFKNVVVNGSGYTLGLGSNEIINGNLTISAGGLDVSSTNNYAITLGGNFTNNGSFNSRSALVTLNGSANQTLGGTSSLTFYNLTQKQASATDTVFMAEAIAVSHNLADSGGVFDCQNYQLSGNNSGTFTMASGTNMLLGSASSSTNVAFPTLFTTAHTTLNSGSTISYLANTAQTISTTPTYGNLVLGSGSSTTRKTPASTTLAVAGNLNVNANTTLVENTGTLNLTGNLTNADTVLFTTGSMNIGGTFTNNGYYAYGTGTATFNGSANAQVTGSNAPTFYNLTLNKTAATDTLFITYPITVNNTLTTTQGVLDCLGSQLTNSANPAVTLSPTSATICSGSSTSLTASGYSAYTWYPSIGLSATTGASVTASPVATTTYTVFAVQTNKYHCALTSGSVGGVIVNYCPGSNCSTASFIKNDSSINNVSMAQAVNWFSFTADTNFMIITLTNPTDTSLGRIKEAVLYGGTCSILDSIMTASVISTTLDSNKYIFDTTLIKGSTYFIKTIANKTSLGNTGICILTGGTTNRVTGSYSQATNNCVSNPCDLVSDGTFDTYNDIVTGGIGNVRNYPYSTLTGGYSDVACWWSPNATAAYFNSAYNTVDPISGLPSNFDNCITIPGVDNENTGTGIGGYIGITAQAINYGLPHYIRTYALEKLANTLTLNVTYNISFWVYLAPITHGHINASDMGIYLSPCYPNKINSTNVYDLLNCTTGAAAQPQITAATGCYPPFNSANTWVKISGQYTANGTENFITIGNFNQGNNATISGTSCSATVTDQDVTYYLDNVSIVPVLDITASPSTTICSGGSTTLTASSGFTTYTWSPGGSTGQSITVTPIVPTTYTVSATLGSGCTTYTNTVTVSIDPGPTLTVTPTPSTICSGSSTSITASGAMTYSWSPSTGLSSSTGATVTTPTLSTTSTYTVTGTDTHGCSSTATATVTVAPLPTAPSGSYTICAGSSVQLGTPCTNPIICPTYLWTAPGYTSTLSDPTVSPSATTTYTVVVKDKLYPGCSSSAGNVVVTVNPTPTITVSGPDLKCTDPPFTYTASGASTYTWAATGGTLSTSTGSSTTVTFTVNNIYAGGVICTGTDGCSSVDTFIVRGCANCDGGTAFNDLVLSSGPASTTSITVTYYSPTNTYTFTGVSACTPAINIFNGIFTVDANLVITNCDIKFGTKAQIVVTGGHNLTIENSHLHACNDMWQGISADGTNSVIIDNTLIEDAINAVVSTNGAQYTITDSYFNKDRIGILVEPYTGTHTGVVYGTTFSCAPSTWSSCATTLSGTAVPLIAPYNTVRTAVGIQTFNDDITLGSSLGVNTFEGIDCGIYTSGSQTTVVNSNFTDIFKSTYSNAGAVFTGVYAIAASSSSYHQLSITDPTYISTFTKCMTGVGVYNGEYADINFNTFTDVGLLNFKTKGVDLQNNVKQKITVKSNSFTDFYIAVNASSNSGSNPINIYDNTITGNNASPALSGAGATFGIYVNEVSPGVSAVYNLGKLNTISGVTNGIYTLNLNNSSIIYNTITINGLGTASGPNNEGIYMGANSNCLVNENNIYYPGTKSLTDGISVHSGGGGHTITCNTIDAPKRSMTFDSKQITTLVDQNNFTLASTGYGIYVNGLNATIGTQPPYTTKYNNTTANTWSPYTNLGGPPWATWVQVGNPASNPTIFNVDPVAVLSSQPYTGMNGSPGPGVQTITFPSVATPDNYPCRLAPPYGPLTYTDSVPLSPNVALGIIQDTNHYLPYNETTKWHEKFILYQYLSQVDSSVADSSIIIKTFLDSARNSNIGFITRINHRINRPGDLPSDITGAESYLADIAYPDTAETTYQTVYAVWLTMLADSASYPDSLSQTILRPIAQECPFQYGMAVYSARALLSAIDTNLYYSTCEVSDSTTGDYHRAIHPQQNIPTAVSAKVYPNPANSLLNIQVQLAQGQTDNMCIYDNMGREVKCEELKNNITSLNIENLPTGIYFYRIVDSSSNLVKADKILIAR